MDAASLLCKSRIGIPTNESPAPLLPPPIGSRRRVGLGFISPQPLALVVIAAAALEGGGCGEAAAEGSSLRHVRPGQIRRQGPRQGQVALLAGRAAVPGGARAPAPAEGQLRGAGGRRGPRLPGRRAGVPLGRDPGAGRQRGPGQQEDPHHPAPPPTRHPQRRGAQQAAGRRHHRPGRRPAQHPGRAPPQEDPELQEVRPAARAGNARGTRTLGPRLHPGGLPCPILLAPSSSSPSLLPGALPTSSALPALVPSALLGQAAPFSTLVFPLCVR